MTTISQQPDDIFTIRAPGKKEGDIIEVADMEDKVRKVRLTMPMGNEFNFVWADSTRPPRKSTVEY